jgi:NAD(P)-dependent dehydrogenase (short-subunit alcohol dehydrogenase family)
MKRLTGKVAIITGASSGIGLETALLFAKEGAKLVLGARRKRELDELVADIRSKDGEAVALPGDVRAEEYARSLVALAVERFGRLDVAFNNAGTLGESGTSTGVSEGGWADTLATNLTGSFLGAKHQIAQMLTNGGGSVIFTSTFVGYTFAFPGVAAFDTGSCSGVWTFGSTCQCDPPRCSRHGHVPDHEQHAGIAGVHHRPSCSEASGEAGRSGAVCAIPRVRRFGVRDRHSVAR